MSIGQLLGLDREKRKSNANSRGKHPGDSRDGLRPDSGGWDAYGEQEYHITAQTNGPDALREETAILDAMDDGEMSAGGRPARRATLHRRLLPWEPPSRSLTKAGLTQALLLIAV